MFKRLSLNSVSQEEAISEAVKALSEGGLVVYPTETTYGVGVDATNAGAVQRLLAYKQRPPGKPFSIFVASQEMAEQYVEINSIAQNLYSNFLPGPLTVVSRSKGTVVVGIASEDGTVGVRWSSYPLVTSMVESFGRPITATSANASYNKRPYSVEDILDTLSEKQKSLITLILDAGELPRNEPSTVVDTTLNQEIVLRQGVLKLTEIDRMVSSSPEETRVCGELLMKKYLQYLGYKSVIFALQGELGAGKTQFTQGVARALGVHHQVSSPTFIIERTYPFAFPSDVSHKNIELHHIDTWRLAYSEELADLGFIKQVEEGNVFAVEWAEKVTDLFERVAHDAVIIWVHIVYGEKENERLITVSDYTL